MIERLENVSRCPYCGGRLKNDRATVPFVLRNSVVVIKNVPAEICANCHEPLLTGAVTDEVTALLRQLRAVGSEVSVVSYSPQLQPALALGEERVAYGED